MMAKEFDATIKQQFGDSPTYGELKADRYKSVATNSYHGYQPNKFMPAVEFAIVSNENC